MTCLKEAAYSVFLRLPPRPVCRDIPCLQIRALELALARQSPESCILHER